MINEIYSRPQRKHALQVLSKIISPTPMSDIFHLSTKSYFRLKTSSSSTSEHSPCLRVPSSLPRLSSLFRVLNFMGDFPQLIPRHNKAGKAIHHSEVCQFPPRMNSFALIHKPIHVVSASQLNWRKNLSKKKHRGSNRRLSTYISQR